MFGISAFVATVIGIMLIYGTSKHQRLRRTSLPKSFLIIGYCLLLLALFFWAQHLSLISALFTWFFNVLLLLICIPLVTLVKHRGELS